MTEKEPQSPQTLFFIQDAITNQVMGPINSQQVRLWFVSRDATDWRISKSPHGPWTAASLVKGLKSTSAVLRDESPPRVATVTPASLLPPAGGDSLPSTESTPAVGWARLAGSFYSSSPVLTWFFVVIGVLITARTVVWLNEGPGRMSELEKSIRALDESIEDSRRARYGDEAYEQSVIREAEYKRAKDELGR